MLTMQASIGNFNYTKSQYLTCAHRSKDGAASCTSASIRDDEQFEFLNDAQCREHCLREA